MSKHPRNMVAMAIDELAQAAFRAGVSGASRSARNGRIQGLAEAGTSFARGPNVALIASTPRLAGLTDPDGAYGTGRVLYQLAILLDRVRAPEMIARQFRDNLAAAVVTHRMRGAARAWDEEDTVAMVLEMWDRIFGRDDPMRARLRETLILPPAQPAADAARKRSLFKWN